MRRFFSHILLLPLSLGLVLACSNNDEMKHDVSIQLGSVWKHSSDTLSDVSIVSSAYADMGEVLLPYVEDSSDSWYLNQFSISDDVLDKVTYLIFRAEAEETSVWLNSRMAQCMPLADNYYLANVTGLFDSPLEKNMLQIRLSSIEGNSILHTVNFMVKNSLHFGEFILSVSDNNQTGTLLSVDLDIRNDSEARANYFLDIEIVNSKGKVVGKLRRDETLGPISSSRESLPVLIDSTGSLTDEYTFKATLSRLDIVYDKIEFKGPLETYLN